MKLVRSIICITVSAVLLLIASASCLPVSALTETYSFDCGLNYSSNGPFRLAGYDPATKKIYEVEKYARATWDEAYPGYWLKDKDTYLFIKTQSGKTEDGGQGYIDQKGYIDMTPKVGLSSAIVFTAPKTGDYYFEGLFIKLEMWGATSTYSLSAHKGDEVLKKTTFSPSVSGGEDRYLTFNVTLNAGDQVIIAANATSDTAESSEIAIIYLTVTRTEEDPTVSLPESSESTTTKPVTTPDTAPVTTKLNEVEEEEDNVLPIVLIASSLAVVIAGVTVIALSKKKK